MENQYFGDINDYRKYGLVRILSDAGKLRIGMCWMLTADDGRTDGRKTHYLSKPEQWRFYDPELFDYLADCLHTRKIRNVDQLSNTQVLPNASFFNEMLTDNPQERQKYFGNALSQFSQNVNLVFFDPDNGIEIERTPIGRKGSSKYVYWDELQAAYAEGHSLLVYQHFPREERNSFIARRAADFRKRIGAKNVAAFTTPNVVFFLAPKPRHTAMLSERARLVENTWGEEIQCHW